MSLVLEQFIPQPHSTHLGLYITGMGCLRHLKAQGTSPLACHFAPRASRDGPTRHSHFEHRRARSTGAASARISCGLLAANKRWRESERAGFAQGKLDVGALRGSAVGAQISRNDGQLSMFPLRHFEIGALVPF